MEKVLERDGKVMLLAYDQGFEHGPVDFDKRNANPAYIMDIATKGNYTGVVFQEGVAAKYYDLNSKVPLVMKLNGKTSFQGDEPLSLQLCSIEKAIKLGAKAVGYTIYVGSEHEERMMAEFSRIEDEAHEAGLPVIGWMYPRGKKVAGKENSKDIVAYAARLGMELNCDYVKVPYTGDSGSFRWVVEVAGKTKVLVQGGKKMSWNELSGEVKGALEAGAAGIAIGRNVWQAEDAYQVSAGLERIIFE